MDACLTTKPFEQKFEKESADHLNLLAYAPCASKPTFKEFLDDFLGMYGARTGRQFRTFVPMGCGADDKLYENIWKSTDIDELPDVIASMGFGDFFRKEFVDRFVSRGCFESVWKGAVKEPFEKLGLRDPDGYYTIYGIIPFLMLVDKKKLGNIPTPRQWNDLLDKKFADNIIIPGSENGDELNDLPMFYYYKESGTEAVKKFAANIKGRCHPSEMARMAGTSAPKGAAVYILPWFFGSCCSRTETVSVVWPEDGALSSPLYLLAKTEKINEVSAITGFLTGAELGSRNAAACTPSLNPDVDDNLPGDASFKWLGWDFIKSHNMAELRDNLKNVFTSEVDKVKGIKKQRGE